MGLTQPHLRFSWATGIVAFFTLATALIFLFTPLIGQSQGYHDFADARTLGPLPNASNVLRNLPFVIFGIWGLLVSGKSDADRLIKLLFSFLFASFVLTGFGSAYYHFNPGNATLVLDRLPIALTVAAFLGIAYAGHLEREEAKAVFILALGYGICSVAYWHFSELNGAGDIRYYALFQFGSLAVIAALLIARPVPGLSQYFWYALGAYVLAKICESLDRQVYDATFHVVSGHSLKHLFASLVVVFSLGIFRVLSVREAA